jgi:hypothetical protein
VTQYLQSPSELDQFVSFRDHFIGHIAEANPVMHIVSWGLLAGNLRQNTSARAQTKVVVIGIETGVPDERKTYGDTG